MILVILDKSEITRKKMAFYYIFMHFLLKHMFLHLYDSLKQLQHALFLYKREILFFLPEKRGDK